MEASHGREIRRTSLLLPRLSAQRELVQLRPGATIPDTQERALGVSVAEQVASALIEQRADDGFRDGGEYVAPDPPVPGVWVPTAPTTPLGLSLPGMQPFSIASADKYRPGPPPTLDSKQWASDYNEVKEVGSSNSATRTPEQTVAARFWGEAPVIQLHGAGSIPAKTPGRFCGEAVAYCVATRPLNIHREFVMVSTRLLRLRLWGESYE